MKKILTLVITAMVLFVGCGAGGSSTKKAPAGPTKIGTYDLTVDMKAGYKIVTGFDGFDIDGENSYINVVEAKKDEVEVSYEAKKEYITSNGDKIIESGKLESGYYISYDDDDQIQTDVVIEKGGKYYDITGYDKTKKDSPTLIAMIKTIK